MKVPYALAGLACLLTVQGASGQDAQLRLTLQDALNRARANSTQFQAAVTNLGLTLEDRTQSRDSLLPTVTYNNSAIYTQSTDLQNQKKIKDIPPVIFIANNSVHEYVSQGNVHEAIDVAAMANFRRTSAATAVARSQAEIAARGLVVAVALRYYSVEAAQGKLEAAKEIATQGEDFLKLNQALERGGEVAHSDVIKAELQMLDRKRQLQEAQLSLLNARLDLAVLIFPDFKDRFELVDDLHATVPLPALAEIQNQAVPDNPDVNAARAAVRVRRYDILSARAGYLPILTLDYFYGIDAGHFAVNSVFKGQKVSNLGASYAATANIPIWNWGSTQSRVHRAELQHSQAKRELSLAERKLLANIQARYAEADVALTQVSELKHSLELAQDSLRLATLRYKNGEARILEVVDAQTAFSSASAAYQDGSVRYHVALAGLHTLTGVLNNP